MLLAPLWQLPPADPLPPAFVAAVAAAVGRPDDRTPQDLRQRPPLVLARLLWARGWRDAAAVAAWLAPATSDDPAETVPGLAAAIDWCEGVRQRGDRWALWAEGEADAIVAVAILAEGWRQLAGQGAASASPGLEAAVNYRVMDRWMSEGDRLRELDRVAAAGVQAIVACNASRGDGQGWQAARSLGLRVLAIDRYGPAHPSPDPGFNELRLSPCTLPPEHPGASLSAGAIAYQLVAAWWTALSPAADRPPWLEELLSWVALGQLADPLALQGAARRLTQQGIAQLKTALATQTARPGLAALVAACQATGDRPTDGTAGVGPRLAALARLGGAGERGVELFLGRDLERGQAIAAEAERAHARRKELEASLLWQVRSQLARVDLSTASLVGLAEVGWPVAALDPVAHSLAEELGRPVVLLAIAGQVAQGVGQAPAGGNLADWVSEQAGLIDRWQGGPDQVTLSLPASHVPLLLAALSRAARQHLGEPSAPLRRVDGVVTVADLLVDGGRSLFRELSPLEPCGRGNPAPRLLIRQARLHQARHSYWSAAGQTLRYWVTRFVVCDASTGKLATGRGFPGVAWGWAAHELPREECDLLVELEYSPARAIGRYDSPQARYELRLLAVASPLNSPPRQAFPSAASPPSPPSPDDMGRSRGEPPRPLALPTCPSSWEELLPWLEEAGRQGRSLTYPPPLPPDPARVWRELVGLAKTLAHSQTPLGLDSLAKHLHWSEKTCQAGLAALAGVGFEVTWLTATTFSLGAPSPQLPPPRVQETAQETAQQVQGAIAHFCASLNEEYFRRRYFWSLLRGKGDPVPTLSSGSLPAEILSQLVSLRLTGLEANRL